MHLSEYVKLGNPWKTYLRIKVTTRQNTTELYGIMDDETLKIRLKAVPEKWKANEELIRFLSKELGINKDSVEIISWASDSIKLIRISL
jgi:uncharacterized protein